MRHESPRTMAMAGGWYLLVGLAAFRSAVASAFGRLGNIGPWVASASGRLGLGRMVIAKLPGGLFREAVPC